MIPVDKLLLSFPELPQWFGTPVKRLSLDDALEVNKILKRP
jgi:hypothetical protein